MRSMRLVDVFDDDTGITCALCQCVNDGGKRLIHAEKMGDLHIIQQMDFCDECLDALARVVIANADDADLSNLELLVNDTRLARWNARSPLDG